VSPSAAASRHRRHHHDDTALADHHAPDVARTRAQREAHADFARPLRHGVGHDRVDADDPQQQRDRRPPGRRSHREGGRRRRAIDERLQRAERRERDRRSCSATAERTAGTIDDGGTGVLTTYDISTGGGPSSPAGSTGR
jgi:hypothetical protein